MTDTQDELKQTLAASEQGFSMDCETVEKEETTDQQDTWQFEPAICG